MYFIQVLFLFFLTVSNAVATSRNEKMENLSSQVQDMISARKMYALKNIAEIEKHMSTINKSGRRLSTVEYEKAVDQLTKHQQSLDRIALVEETEQQRFARGLRR